MPSSNDSATLQALFEGVDAARSEAETTWGAERLPLLVDDEMRAKLRRQQERWSRALQDAWSADMLTRGLLEAAQSAAGGMRRAWAALSVAASEAGHRPLHVDVWEVRLADGSIAALVRDNDAAAHVIASGRHLSVYTVAEIAHVIDALPPALQLAKVEWPGAKVQARNTPHVKPDWYVTGGDQIPF